MTREEAVIILDGFKNNPLFNSTHARAFDMAISALSAEGEYIKKEDILNELGDVNMDILTDEVKETVNDLPSYSFPDSAEILDKISAEIKELTKAHCIQVMDREDIPLLALDIIEKYKGDSK